MSDKSFSLKRLYPGIGVTVFGLGAFLIYRALRGHCLEEIVQSLGAISSTHLALGAAFTAGSYLCLTANDTLAIRYTKGDLPYRRIALASLISLSIGHTLGLAAFSSGAVRYRFYTAWGLSAGDVGRIILFCGATVLVGVATLGAIAGPDAAAAGRAHDRCGLRPGDRRRRRAPGPTGSLSCPQRGPPPGSGGSTADGLCQLGGGGVMS